MAEAAQVHHGGRAGAAREPGRGDLVEMAVNTKRSARACRAMAVVGSGVAGLTAAYVLSQKYDVTLFEADDRLGGHVHTHDVVAPDIGSLAVDSGFIVHNEKTYPLLIRLFAELGVQTQPTDMSLSVRCEGCGLEYAGARGVGGLFAKPSSIFNGAFLNMLREVRVFHRRAREVLQDGGDELTYGEFLSSRGFSRYFINHFALPIVACVWSTSSESALRYPARYLFTFLDNHGMLAVSGSPQWRTVVGGSRTYVDRLAKELHSVATSTPVRTITRHHDGAEIRDDFDQVHRFDGVVVATHADTAALLTRKTERRGALGAERVQLFDVRDVAPHRRAGPAEGAPGPGVVELSAGFVRQHHGPGVGVLRHESPRGHRLGDPPHRVPELV